MKLSSTLRKLVLTSGLASVLIACGNNTTEVNTASTHAKSAPNSANVQLVSSVDAFTPKVIEQDIAVKVIQRDEATKSLSAKQALQIQLTPPTNLDLAPLKNQTKKSTSDVPKAYQIGFSRPVSQTEDSKSTAKLLNWTSLSNGNALAAIQISSPSAKGMRIGIKVDSLPLNAILRVHNGQSNETFQIQASHVLKLIASNIAADGDSSDARTYWTPMTFGAATTLEIELPAGTDTSSVNISIPTISHAVQTPLEAAFSTADPTKAAGSCNVDATCTLPPAANAVAQMDYQVGTGLYVCTGTLLADSVASGTPHFLTAYHCISTQTVASSLETYWFWRSNACNSTAINPGWIGRHSGATYVWGRYGVSAGTTSSYTPTGTDTSFLKLLDTPPTGAMFAGWNASPQTISTTTNYVGLHNPMGDFLKRSDGNIVGYSISLATGDYSSSTITTLPRYRVGWTAGVTEGGSSGSPLFLNGTSSNPQVVGQLYGGASSCSNPTGTDSYGRFDIAYQLALSDWLMQGVKRVSRFYNSASGTHFYSISASESNYIKATFPSFSFEGTPFGASTVTATGLSPVHRFYNLSLGVHFYTINESERAFVAANLPQMRYEGIAWYANANTVAGTVPLYRFYNRDKGVHFYTVNITERDWVIANLPQMNNEGIAYYVLP